MCEAEARGDGGCASPPRPVAASSFARRPILSILALGLFAAACTKGEPEAATRARPVVDAGPRTDLQTLLDTLAGPVRVQLAPGDYHLHAVAFTDSTCGNCRDPGQKVPATRGLLVRGDSIELVGASAGEVVVHTHAGYGIVFDGCRGCGLRDLTVTDGIRDPDSRAADAGVVVRRGRVTLSDCIVRDNVGDSAMVIRGVVGIMGVVVREQGTAEVRGCRVERNSWDGLAAYRDARLLALGNVVDGVDRAHGAEVGGGRGVGIGLTWNARGILRGNLVTRYWKGIGVFVDAQAFVSDNVVEDVLTWGLADWGPDGSRPVAWFERNAVFEAGACGALVDRAASYGPEVPPGPRRDGMDVLADKGPGALVDNVFVRTGQDERYDTGEPYCVQRPIARLHVPDGFRIADNLVWDSRQPGVKPPPEDTLTAAQVEGRVAPLVRALEAWPNLADSRFLGAFGPPG